jgi:hypothetical protein
LNAQEAWAQAIFSFRGDNSIETISKWLSNLSVTANLSSIPRKWVKFHSYILRNKGRLNLDNLNHSIEVHARIKSRVDDTHLANDIREMYGRIKKRQMSIMNLPEATAHEESAYGQLILLGFADGDVSSEESSSPQDRTNLYVVHRLDCEVSQALDADFEVLFIGTESKNMISSQAGVRSNGVCSQSKFSVKTMSVLERKRSSGQGIPRKSKELDTLSR